MAVPPVLYCVHRPPVGALNHAQRRSQVYRKHGLSAAAVHRTVEGARWAAQAPARAQSHETSTAPVKRRSSVHGTSPAVQHGNRCLKGTRSHRCCYNCTVRRGQTEAAVPAPSSARFVPQAHHRETVICSAQHSQPPPQTIRYDYSHMISPASQPAAQWMQEDDGKLQRNVVPPVKLAASRASHAPSRGALGLDVAAEREWRTHQSTNAGRGMASTRPHGWVRSKAEIACVHSCEAAWRSG